MHHSLLGYPRQLGGSVFDVVCLVFVRRIIYNGYTILLFSFPFFQQTPINLITINIYLTGWQDIFPWVKGEGGGGGCRRWALRNAWGGVPSSVTKHYKGVGGCQVFRKKVLRNTWMAPKVVEPV